MSDNKSLGQIAWETHMADSHYVWEDMDPMVQEEWNETANRVRDAVLAEHKAEVEALRREREDLAMCVRRLIMACRDTERGCEVSDKAADYLKRKGLGGNIIRAAGEAREGTPGMSLGAHDYPSKGICAMTAKNAQPDEEEVLLAFSVEPTHDGNTLQHYLKEYPEYTAALVACSIELMVAPTRSDEEVSASETTVDRAWQRFQSIFQQRSTQPNSELPSWPWHTHSQQCRALVLSCSTRHDALEN